MFEEAYEASLISIHALRKECDWLDAKVVEGGLTNFYPRTP